MEQRVGSWSSHSWLRYQVWLSASARGFWAPQKVCCVGHNVVAETPVPEMDGLHAEWPGPGAVLFVCVCHCGGVVRENLDMLIVEQRQERVTSKVDHAQLQNVDVHACFSGSPCPLRGTAI